MHCIKEGVTYGLAAMLAPPLKSDVARGANARLVPYPQGREGVVDVSIVLQNWQATFQPRRCVPEIASDPGKAIGVATRGAGALIFVLHKKMREIHKTKFITTTIIGPKVIRITTEKFTLSFLK
jgi:hypothetical protein